jgi:hypothetical protein
MKQTTFRKIRKEQDDFLICRKYLEYYFIFTNILKIKILYSEIF